MAADNSVCRKDDNSGRRSNAIRERIVCSGNKTEPGRFEILDNDVEFLLNPIDVA